MLDAASDSVRNKLVMSWIRYRSNARMIDTHIHLDRLDDGPAQIQAAIDAGVRGFVSIGLDPRQSQALRGALPATVVVKTALGLHPQEVRDAADVDDAFAALARRLDTEDIAAIGECGLDARPGIGNAELHEVVFRRHLRLARERNLPVVLHGVRRDGAMLDVIDDERRGQPLRGVWHGFSGSKDTMQLAIARGLHVSIGFVILDPRTRRARDAVPHIPNDRLLVETDAPPLAPERLKDVVAAVALLRGCAPEEIVATTMLNAQRLFGFP